MLRAALRGLAQMCDESDPFVFPELPDEAAAALDHFLEDFYNSFQERYGLQLYRYYRAIEERAPATVRCHRHSCRSRIHRSEILENDRGADAAVTIADGPSPIVNISPSN